MIYFFLLVASYGSLRSTSLSFDFDFSNNSTFSPTDITTELDAKYNGGLYDLTANATYRVGRVSYAHPVQLRDSATDEIASFTTAFSFTIIFTGGNKKGDGMAFFLSTYPSVVPDKSQGGNLGLCNNCNTSKAAGQQRFVAVEFDTFNNTWDPSLTNDHMGINVNLLKSQASISLPDNSLDGQMSARVDYNGSTGVMNVELQFYGNQRFPPGTTPIFNLSTTVDLRAELPEQVAIGFSAATGDAIELHQLRSWSFSLISPAGRKSY